MKIGKWQVIWWGRWPTFANLGPWPKQEDWLDQWPYIYCIRLHFGLFELRRLSK